MNALSPPEHTATSEIDEAGRWLVAQSDMTGRAVVPELKTRFGLSSLEACEAIRAADRFRREARHGGG